MKAAHSRGVRSAIVGLCSVWACVPEVTTRTDASSAGPELGSAGSAAASEGDGPPAAPADIESFGGEATASNPDLASSTGAPMVALPCDADAATCCDAGNICPPPPPAPAPCGERGQPCCNGGAACQEPLACRNDRCTSCASLRGLGSLSYATAVSADGSTVVGISGNRAYFWSATEPDQVRGNLGDLQGALEGSPGVAASTSGNGEIVVGQSSYGCGGDPTSALDCRYAGNPRSFFWSAETPMRELRDPPDLEPSLTLRGATSVSADGRFVTLDAADRAFRWTRSADSYEPIVDLAQPETVAAITTKGMSSDGAVVVGQRTDVDSSTRAFRWSSATGSPVLEYLPSLPDEDPSNRQSSAWGVSADGRVVVGRSQRADGAALAVRWTPDGVVALPSLSSGSDSLAYATNADGSIVVGYVENETDAGFIWDAASGLRLLQSVLPASLVSGWQLGSAMGISADGTVVVGNGLRQGDGEAWIAVLGEDCSSP